MDVRMTRPPKPRMVQSSFKAPGQKPKRLHTDGTPMSTRTVRHPTQSNTHCQFHISPDEEKNNSNGKSLQPIDPLKEPVPYRTEYRGTEHAPFKARQQQPRLFFQLCASISISNR